MSFEKILNILTVIGSFLSRLLGSLSTKPVKEAYRKASEAERETAVAQEKVVKLSQEKASIELRKKEIDDFFDDEEY